MESREDVESGPGSGDPEQLPAQGSCPIRTSLKWRAAPAQSIASTMTCPHVAPQVLRLPWVHTPLFLFSPSVLGSAPESVPENGWVSE